MKTLAQKLKGLTVEIAAAPMNAIVNFTDIEVRGKNTYFMVGKWLNAPEDAPENAKYIAKVSDLRTSIIAIR